MEELLYRYNPWWENNFHLEGIIERPAIFDSLKKKMISSEQIILLTGLRRVGKTTLMKLCINYLLIKEKVEANKIFYFSLDDYMVSKNSILEIIEEYRKIHKLPFSSKIYLFLDEISYKENFELQLKNLYDQHNMKIMASSSSSSILKSKKPYLTGRNTTIEVQPLDFEEYLEFKKINLAKADHHLKERYFEDFLKTGGIPKFVLTDDIEYLKELVDDIIYKDIAAFHGIKNPAILRDFFLLLMERSGKVVSINKLAKIMQISVDTAKRYLNMFADTYLIHLVQRYGKTNEKVLAPNKVYATDLGIRTLFTGFRDKGSLFENYIFLKIAGQKPYYIYQDGNEIDFYTSDQVLIEVKYGSELNQKQQNLFKNFQAKQKIIIKNFEDIQKLYAGGVLSAYR